MEDFLEEVKRVFKGKEVRDMRRLNQPTQNFLRLQPGEKFKGVLLSKSSRPSPFDPNKIMYDFKFQTKDEREVIFSTSAQSAADALNNNATEGMKILIEYVKMGAKKFYRIYELTDEEFMAE